MEPTREPMRPEAGERTAGAPSQSIPKNRQLLIEYHSLARADVQHDDTRRWTLFGAFLIAETVLTTLLTKGHDAIVALLGMVSTLFIGLAIWRNNVYLRDRSLLARRLEEEIGPSDEGLRFYDHRAQIPRVRLSEQNGYGFAREIQQRISHSAVDWLHAWATMRITLAAAFIAWVGVALTALHVARPYVVAILVGMAGFVILDWVMEIDQRIGDARKKRQFAEAEAKSLVEERVGKAP